MKLNFLNLPVGKLESILYKKELYLRNTGQAIFLEGEIIKMVTDDKGTSCFFHTGLFGTKVVSIANIAVKDKIKVGDKFLVKYSDWASSRRLRHKKNFFKIPQYYIQYKEINRVRGILRKRRRDVRFGTLEVKSTGFSLHPTGCDRTRVLLYPEDRPGPKGTVVLMGLYRPRLKLRRNPFWKNSENGIYNKLEFFKPYLGEQIKFEPILYSLFYEIVYLNKSINLPLLAKSSSLASQLYKLYIYKIFYLFLFMGLRGLRKDHLAYFEIFSHLLPALKLTVKKPRKIAINLPFLYQNDKIFGGHFFYHNFKGALKGVPGSCFYLLCVTVVWFSFNFAQRQNTEDKFINAIWHGWNRVLFWTGAYPRPKNPRYTPSISVEEQYTRFLFMHKKMLYYITSNRFHFNEKLFLSKKKKKRNSKKKSYLLMRLTMSGCVMVFGCLIVLVA